MQNLSGRLSATWVGLAALVAISSCNSGVDPEGQTCGENRPCPAGFECNPLDRRCYAFSPGTIDAPAAPDAPPPDAEPIDGPLAPDAPEPSGLSIAPAAHDFGPINVGGASLPLTFTVTNVGAVASGALGASVSDPGSFSITGGTCAGQSLAAGASCTVIVTFRPMGAPGAVSGTLTVSGPAAAATASLSATALGAGELTVSSALHDFGLVAVGAMSDAATFTITNSGQTPTGAVTATLSDSVNYVISSNSCSGPLGAGASCVVAVRFAPQSVGAKQGVSLGISAAPGGAVAVALGGTGTATLMVVVTNAGGGVVLSDPAGIDCGATCVASFSASSVTLTAQASETHTFDGWSGPCSGTGPCTVALGAAMVMVSAGFTPLVADIDAGAAAMADVQVTGSAAPDPVLHGQALTYTFTVTNLGPDPASGGTFTAELPQGVAFGATTAPAASCAEAAGTVTCQLQTLASGASATIAIQVTTSAAGQPSVTAEAAAMEMDPDLENNTATVAATVSPVADLAVSALTDAPDPVVVGGDITYSITVHNAGPDTVASAVVTDNLAPSLSFVSATVGGGSCLHAAGVVTCQLDNIASGASPMITIVATTGATGQLSNQATVASDVHDPVAANNVATTTTTAQAPPQVPVTLTVTVSGGGSVTSSPAGISSCTSSCTASFTAGTPVVLTATSGGTTRFAGWGGACAGSIVRDCPVTISADRTITASFTPVTHNLVFVSSVAFPSNLLTPAAYDAECNKLASAAGLNSEMSDLYVAWISDGGSNAAVRLGATKARGFIRVDGAPFADSMDSVAIQNRVLNAINLDENGRPVAATVWTGTAGDLATAQATCSSWSGSGSGVVGDSTRGPTMWTEAQAVGCGGSHRIYCFMRKFTDAMSVTPVSGRKIFVAPWTPGLGIQGANEACERMRPPGTTGPLAALLPSYNQSKLGGADPRSAESLLVSGVNYVRPDGILVGTRAELRGTPLSGVWQYGGNGAYVAGGTLALTGLRQLNRRPMSTFETCFDWTYIPSEAFPAMSAHAGMTNSLPNWWDHASASCTTPTIYCVEGPFAP